MNTRDFIVRVRSPDDEKPEDLLCEAISTGTDLMSHIDWEEYGIDLINSLNCVYQIQKMVEFTKEVEGERIYLGTLWLDVGQRTDDLPAATKQLEDFKRLNVGKTYRLAQVLIDGTKI